MLRRGMKIEHLRELGGFGGSAGVLSEALLAPKGQRSQELSLKGIMPDALS
jgi:hypothetical protein